MSAPVESGEWFGSPERAEFVRRMESIWVLRRCLMCFGSWRDWRKARALSVAALHAKTNMGAWYMFDHLCLESDRAFAKIFGLKL